MFAETPRPIGAPSSECLPTPNERRFTANVSIRHIRATAPGALRSANRDMHVEVQKVCILGCLILKRFQARLSTSERRADRDAGSPPDRMSTGREGRTHWEL